MAEQERPNQNANKSKAEGERWSAEQYSVRNSDRDRNPEQDYPSDANTGGITNRPISEERENQQDLPERGTHRDQTEDPGSTRPEGDFKRSQP